MLLNMLKGNFWLIFVSMYIASVCYICLFFLSISTVVWNQKRHENLIFRLISLQWNLKIVGLSKLGMNVSGIGSIFELVDQFVFIVLLSFFFRKIEIKRISTSFYKWRDFPSLFCNFQFEIIKSHTVSERLQCAMLSF